MASTGQVQEVKNNSTKLPLRVATYVVDFQITPIKKTEMYDKELQCDLPGPQSRLQSIHENDEYDSF